MYVLVGRKQALNMELPDYWYSLDKKSIVELTNVFENCDHYRIMLWSSSR